MRKLLFSLCLFAVASAFSFAQSAIWAGNAARGNDDAFPASVRSSGKSAGISLALPEGTLVQVKNQKNGITTDVTIVSGQGKPGIFLLLNSSAADSLEIHTGEVIMVEIEEKKSVANPFLDYSADPDAFKKNLNEEFLSSPTEDPDNTALVDVTGEMDRMGYEQEGTETDSDTTSGEPRVEASVEVASAGEGDRTVESVPTETPVIAEAPALEENPPAMEEPVIEEPVTEEEPITVPPVSDGREYEDVIIADGAETYDSVLDFTPEEELPEEEPVETAETERFLSDSIVLTPEVTAETSDDINGETGEVTEAPLAENSVGIADAAVVPEAAEEVPAPVIDPGRVIYFLTPAELRPPEPVEESPALPEWEAPVDVAVSEGDLLVPEEKEEPAAAEETVSEIKSAEPGGTDEIVFVPQYVDSADLTAYMQETLKAGSRYVQVATFSKASSDTLYRSMVSLQEAFPYLPLMLLPGKDGKSFRLMAGPVSRDEVGILIYAMKAHGFDQAFLARE